MKRAQLAYSIALMLFSVSCAPTRSQTPTGTSPDTASPTTPTAIPQAEAPTSTPLPQSTATPFSYGPGPADFPAGINPLTGQAAADPALLKVPAMLVSISHFPVTARPQAGLSFAPYVFEFSITEGQTRFLATFYGQYPAPEVPIKGNCDVRSGAFVQTGTLLGNRVWLDSNKDGVQDPLEPGIPGVCVSLLDANGVTIAETTTDSNGYYGFNVDTGKRYFVHFLKPGFLDLTKPNIGDEDDDSDADPETGQTPVLRVTEDDRLVDAGMLPNGSYVPPPADSKSDPKPEIGPVRSGRLLYAHIGNFFQDSCLIYAFASDEVLPLIPHCAFVTHEVSGGGYMLPLDRFKAIAEENQRKTASRPFNYTGNVYSDTIPAAGKPAVGISEYYALLNQSGWFYDPLYGAYLRYVDTADKNAPGALHPEVDRLTGRQLHFENVIVVMADTDVISPTNIDIHLDAGDTGYAYLFRDGQMFPIRWSTRAGSYEQKTGFRRPIHFEYSDGTLVALKPGHTWITIVTPFSSFKEEKPGIYFVGYAAPEGEAR